MYHFLEFIYSISHIFFNTATYFVDSLKYTRLYDSCSIIRSLIPSIIRYHILFVMFTNIKYSH